MTHLELQTFLEKLDYSGALEETLARIPDEAITQFRIEHERAELESILYFGMRRLAAESGISGDMSIPSEQGVKILALAWGALVLAFMERARRIVVVWPESPFAHPEQQFIVTRTAAREHEYKTMMRKLRPPPDP